MASAGQAEAILIHRKRPAGPCAAVGAAPDAAHADTGPISALYAARMTEPAEPPKSPRQLLLNAIDRLPQEDRDAVLTWLLGRLGGPIPMELPTQYLSHAQGAGSARERAAAMVFGHSQASLSEEQRIVPVRFAAAQHAALQAWCQEHGFSMA